MGKGMERTRDEKGTEVEVKDGEVEGEWGKGNEV